MPVDSVMSDDTARSVSINTAPEQRRAHALDSCDPNGISPPGTESDRVPNQSISNKRLVLGSMQ